MSASIIIIIIIIIIMRDAVNGADAAANLDNDSGENQATDGGNSTALRRSFSQVGAGGRGAYCSLHALCV